MVVATDSLVTFRVTDGSRGPSFSIGSRVTAMAFSASGHRLYVATETGDFVVLERFQFTELTPRRQLPGPVDRIRVDPFGRYLLLHPAGRDSIWITGSSDLSNLASVAGSWDDDLPATAADGTILVRQGGDVVGIDASTHTETARVSADPADKWLVASWQPRRPTLLVEDEEESEEAQPADQTVYAQLHSTSSGVWARERVRTLREAGIDARVLEPNEFDDRYRVVLGPFGTRSEADNIARRLGQPYFLIFQRDTTTTITNQ